MYDVRKTKVLHSAAHRCFVNCMKMCINIRLIVESNAKEGPRFPSKIKADIATNVYYHVPIAVKILTVKNVCIYWILSKLYLHLYFSVLKCLILFFLS